MGQVCGSFHDDFYIFQDVCLIFLSPIPFGSFNSVLGPSRGSERVYGRYITFVHVESSIAC